MLLKKLLQKNYRLLKSCLQQLYLKKMMALLLHLVFVFTPANKFLCQSDEFKSQSDEFNSQRDEFICQQDEFICQQDEVNCQDELVKMLKCYFLGTEQKYMAITDFGN